MKGSVYHGIDFLTRVPQTLLSLLKAGPLGELARGRSRDPPQAHTNNVVLFFNQVSLGFLKKNTISDFVEA